MKGNPVPQAPKGSEWLPKVGNNQTAAGNSQGTALAIPSGQDLTVCTSVAASTGVILPASGVSFSPPEEYIVINHGANPLTVYPQVGGQLGTLGLNAGLAVAAGKGCHFWYVGPLQWAYNNSA